MKKYKIFLISFSVIFIFSFASQAKATMSIDEMLALIVQLKNQIVQLQNQLAGIRKEPTALTCQFNLNLKLGDKGSSVLELQEALEKEGFNLGTEKTTQYFGIITRLAVINFQERYADEILTPLGLKNGTGFVGNATRLKLKNIYCNLSQESELLPSVSFSYPIYSVLENEPYALITVNLSAAASKDINVSYETANGGTATPNIDYYAASGVLTFIPGQTSATFKVNIIDDQVAETDETIKLRLFNFRNGKLGDPVNADLYIIDDDHSKPKVYFKPLFYSVDENVNTVLVNVLLSESTPDTVTVQYYTSDLTAKAGSDYQAVEGTLTFIPGEISKNIQISIINDSIYEGNEIFNITLKNPDKAELPLIRTATISIKDDEQPLPTLRFDPIFYSINENSQNVILYVSLSAASNNEVTVNYQTSDLTAKAGSDYQAANGTLNFAPGQISKTIPIVILDDTVYEGNEMFTVSLKDPVNANLGLLKTATISIKDDESSNQQLYQQQQQQQQQQY